MVWTDSPRNPNFRAKSEATLLGQRRDQARDARHGAVQSEGDLIIGAADVFIIWTVIRLRLSTLINPQYVNLFNNSRISWAYYAAHASGTSSSMKNVSREVILNLPVAMPPAAEQDRIVARVAELRQFCADLRARLAARRTCHARLADVLVEQAAASSAENGLTLAQAA